MDEGCCADERCIGCGAYLTAPGGITFKTLGSSAGGVDAVSGGLLGHGCYADGILVGTLDAGTFRTPVSAWCSHCHQALPDKFITLTIG